ncbi:helix-turn-helix domain-containing protein [Clostridium sp. JS66]|uniref:PucR family transcriptional regulator n=1 Tax=Clostridium sp. JS66 TaxID=3064705 RepID=UPI00298EA15F|nr:helix-turn-helix domain-containing protein [Clostridium sp. JS66]WPC43432.1 helix-turn-helix domain-containing protein [Clostridium sp. JS66]
MRFTSLANSRKYYLQALKANEISQRYNRYVSNYDVCIKYIISDLINSQYDFMDFCHHAVIYLAKEDSKNNTNFLETLKYYIYFTNSPNDAIHRNTLFYRINKIKQLTNITLDNADEILHIYYSIELIEINNK